MSNELIHYGVPGMKWGVRKSYHSTSIRSALARRSNDKVDESFKKWNENFNKKANAIELGKKANVSKRAYESDKKNNKLRQQYIADNKAYKKALKGNTTYRKGQIRREVGSDLSRKYLSDAKKIKKQLDADPTNKVLKKQYNQLMSKHDVERARARRSQDVGAKRSAKIASIKRTTTMTVKAVATTAAVTAGAYAVNKKLNKSGVSIKTQNIRDLMDAAEKFKNLMGYMY